MRKLFSWLQGSVYRAILLALIIVSVVPIVTISVLFTRQSMEALTHQMEENLLLLAQSKAEEINLKLTGVMDSTVMAAYQASGVLQQPLDETEVEERLARYQPDHRGIIGLDVYYNNHGGADTFGEDLSNVYWTEDLEPETSVARQILVTERLDPLFAGIKSVNPDTQWIYMTTTEGMMRLYPWASNDHYPDNWEPREIVFYTVAEPANNPDLAPRWTAPYVDYAGAGWMVTASVPILDQNNQFLGVMSHDVTIESLKEIALGINVLDGDGYGFLIDSEGQVIAHPDYQSSGASKGTQDETNLLAVGSTDYRELIQDMAGGGTGHGYYNDDSGQSLLVYATVPETDWSLGISIPREVVVAPAMAMRNRAIAITLVLVAIAVGLAIFLSRLIHRPILQLLQGVQQISADRKADEVHVNSFDEFRHLAGAFNEMAARVWERESRLKAKVAEMRIEIDAQRKEQQLEAIVETDFFKRLETNAGRLRADIKGVSASD